MEKCQPLPRIWLLSDQRNDAQLERAIGALPRGSGFVFRHYHLNPQARKRRFEELYTCAKRAGHAVVMAAGPEPRAACPCDGVYGPVSRITDAPGLKIGTVHDHDEVLLANQAKVDAVMISPVFATQTHPGSAFLGVEAFFHLAAMCTMPAIALGGMNRALAAKHGIAYWGAIDGLSAGT